MTQITDRLPHPPARQMVRTHALGQVVILDVAGRLSDILEPLDWATRLALAQSPRGVVCDLSGVVEAGATGALRGLAMTGRHPRDWPGVPVAMACLDPRAGATLRGEPLGGHLMVSGSLRGALSSVLHADVPVVETLRLAPHETAPQASRDFIGRTLVSWRLTRGISEAALVVSELVANAVTHAQTEIELAVSVHRRAIRIAVHDHGPGAPVPLAGRGARRPPRTCVARLSRACGVLPSAEGGTLAWAVLDAAPDPGDE